MTTFNPRRSIQLAEAADRGHDTLAAALRAEREKDRDATTHHDEACRRLVRLRELLIDSDHGGEHFRGPKNAAELREILAALTWEETDG